MDDSLGTIREKATNPWKSPPIVVHPRQDHDPSLYSSLRKSPKSAEAPRLESMNPETGLQKIFSGPETPYICAVSNLVRRHGRSVGWSAVEGGQNLARININIPLSYHGHIDHPPHTPVSISHPQARDDRAARVQNWPRPRSG